MTVPLLNARQQLRVSRVLGDDHYKRMPCGTLRNPHCPMAMSAEHRSKFAAPHLKWRRLQMSEKFSSVTKKKPKKQKTFFILFWFWNFSHLNAGNHLIFYEWTIKINQAKYFQSWGLIQCDGFRWNAAKHSHFDIVFQTNTRIIEWWKTTWLLEYYWTCRNIYMYCNKACFI